MHVTHHHLLALSHAILVVWPELAPHDETAHHKAVVSRPSTALVREYATLVRLAIGKEHLRVLTPIVYFYLRLLKRRHHAHRFLFLLGLPLLFLLQLLGWEFAFSLISGKLEKGRLLCTFLFFWGARMLVVIVVVLERLVFRSKLVLAKWCAVLVLSRFLSMLLQSSERDALGFGRLPAYTWKWEVFCWIFLNKSVSFGHWWLLAARVLHWRRYRKLALALIILDSHFIAHALGWSLVRPHITWVDLLFSLLPHW